MEKSHKKFSPVVEEERDKIISEIVTAKNICKRIIDDEYLMTALYPVEQKYGEGHFDFIDCENGDQTMVDNRTDEHKSAWAETSAIATKQQADDEDLFWRIVKEKLHGWWY